MNCSPPGSSVRGILQVRILEWVPTAFSRGSSQPRERTQVWCIAGRLFTSEPPGTPPSYDSQHLYFFSSLSKMNKIILSWLTLSMRHDVISNREHHSPMKSYYTGSFLSSITDYVIYLSSGGSLKYIYTCICICI